MNVSLHLLLARFRTVFSASAELLAPHSAACLICGKPHYFASGMVGIHTAKLTAQLRNTVCGACLSAVPWLTRILCPVCGRGIYCEDCTRGGPRSFICNRSAVYYNQAMKGLLAQYKYRGNEQLAPLLGDMLIPAFEKMTEQIVLGKGVLTHHIAKQRSLMAVCWDAVTYVPISTERASDRGFNQAEQLASHIAERYRLPLRHLLIRERHTEKQSFKTRSERMRDTKQLFGVNETEWQKLQKKNSHPNKSAQPAQHSLRILLVDDIYTTGSTAEACSQILNLCSEKPVEIYILTWARS